MALTVHGNAEPPRTGRPSRKSKRPLFWYGDILLDVAHWLCRQRESRNRCTAAFMMTDATTEVDRLHCCPGIIHGQRGIVSYYPSYAWTRRGFVLLCFEPPARKPNFDQPAAPIAPHGPHRSLLSTTVLIQGKSQCAPRLNASSDFSPSGVVRGGVEPSRA